MFDFNYAANNMAENQAILRSRFENIKNQFTPGYKAQEVNFNDIMGSTMAGGAQVKDTGISFKQGQIFKTQTATNLAINGQGFFVVKDCPEKEYTRDGRFTWQDGSLKDSMGKSVVGFPLDSNGNISGDSKPINLTMDPKTKLYAGKYTGFHFDSTGKLYGESTITDPTTGQKITTSTPLFQVAVASFANPSGLKRAGVTSFAASKDSGGPVVGVAGQGALGAIVPGALELSNVNFMQEGAAIGMAKQNFEANMAAFKAMNKLTTDAMGLVH